LITSGSGATIPVDPPAVVAGNESRSATLHRANGGTSADDTARIAASSFEFRFGNGGCRDDGDEGENSDEEGTHFVEG